MPSVTATAALAGRGILACSVLSERITITPGNVQTGGNAYGPLASSSYVVVPGTTDGIYDT